MAKTKIIWKIWYDVKSSYSVKAFPDPIFSGLDPDPVLVVPRPEPQLTAQGYLSTLVQYNGLFL